MALKLPRLKTTGFCDTKLEDRRRRRRQGRRRRKREQKRRREQRGRGRREKKEEPDGRAGVDKHGN